MGHPESKPEQGTLNHEDKDCRDSQLSFDFQSTGVPNGYTNKHRSLETEARQSQNEFSRFSFNVLGGYPSGHLRETRHVKIKMPDGMFESLHYCPEDKLTVAWLYSEYYRILISTFQSGKMSPGVELHNILLTCEDGDLNIDYLLADYGETLDKLPDGIKLVPFERYAVPGSLTLKDITIIKNIGVGGFSKVFLVRRNDTGHFSALKFVSKKDLKKNSKEEYAFNEKKLLTKLSHKFINRFLYSFQTNNVLCFGLEYCQGGSLYEMLKKQRSFSEEVVRVCIAQVSLALAYLHKKGVIYRDLKAENILIDKRGNIKLCDFGLSKKVADVRDLNETFCGSPDYLSPEVLKKEGYNYMRDVFSLGVLTYELLIGVTPFYSTEIKDIYSRILNDSPSIKKPVSNDCRNFILACLEKDPKMRLGYVNGMADILAHPWLRTIVYNINKENNKYNPFQEFVPKKNIISNSSPSLNFLNDYYHSGELMTQAAPANRYFDFSFRLSTDHPEEFADLEDHSGYSRSAHWSLLSPDAASRQKIKMASNIQLLN